MMPRGAPDESLSRARRVVRLRGQRVTLGDRTLVMGIVNCTPDSFYDGGRHIESTAAVAHYHRLVAEGADWIDVGGESTRPGAESIPASEEWRRVAPVIEAARRAGHPVPLSIDTTKASIAERALAAGVTIVNDVSGLRGDARMAALAARSGAGLILMHARATPATMQSQAIYGDVVVDVRAELAASVDAAVAAGVDREQILIDPGIGFAKAAHHNFEILRRLRAFASLDRPLLIGCSRKRFIGAVEDLAPEERLEGTLAAHAAAALAGAHVVRVHDVRPHVAAMRLIDAILAGEKWEEIFARPPR